MKFTISGEHQKIFRRSKLVEFADVLQKGEMLLLKEGVDEALANRGAEGGEVRDLWRGSTKISKLICHRRLGELVFQLTDKRPVRMGYDVYLQPSEPGREDLTSLKDTTSLQGILCGVLFPLVDSPSEVVIENVAQLDLKRGNALFLHPELPFPWRRLAQEIQLPFYLAIYTSEKSVYVYNRQDPDSRFLFGQGYAFGDRLTESMNPIIFR